MTISTAHYREQELTGGRSITPARGPATGRSVARLEKRVGLSQIQLANCGLTWYAYFNTQLRAGYSLTFWNERGKASTVSLTAGSPANVESTRWLQGGERPGFCLMPVPAAQAQADRPGPGQFQGPVVTPVRPWLTTVTSRGSPPIAAPRGGGHRSTCRCDTRLQLRKATRAAGNGGSS